MKITIYSTFFIVLISMINADIILQCKSSEKGMRIVVDEAEVFLSPDKSCDISHRFYPFLDGAETVDQAVDCDVSIIFPNGERKDLTFALMRFGDYSRLLTKEAMSVLALGGGVVMPSLTDMGSVEEGLVMRYHVVFHKNSVDFFPDTSSEEESRSQRRRRLTPRPVSYLLLEKAMAQVGALAKGSRSSLVLASPTGLTSRSGARSFQRLRAANQGKRRSVIGLSRDHS